MKVRKKRISHRKILLYFTIFLVVISMILYKLADRYLIEHVEVKNAITNNTSTKSNQYVEDFTADNWSYASDSKKITIKKRTTSASGHKTTYFVADVQLKDASSLKSAFAKNQFGNNIIEFTSDIAKENNAIFAINGDYYGFRDDGITIRNSKVFRDQPARTGLALYQNGSMKTYEETDTSASELLSSGVTQTFSFGPILVKNSKTTKDFGKLSIDKNFGNRSIEDSNPRTGIGIISPNHFVFIVVDGRSRNYSDGFTLDEFAKIFEDLGCTDAYNLDGGGSSTMYFMGRVVNNPLGKHEERGVSDIIYIN